MSHTWNFELKISVKWLVKFRRRIVQKLKVSTIVNFRGFQIRDRHNSSTWPMVIFLFSIFKNATRVMIEHKISGSLKHCKGLKTPLTFNCNLFLKSRYNCHKNTIKSLKLLFLTPKKSRNWTSICNSSSKLCVWHAPQFLNFSPKKKVWSGLKIIWSGQKFFQIQRILWCTFGALVVTSLCNHVAILVHRFHNHVASWHENESPP